MTEEASSDTSVRLELYGAADAGETPRSAQARGACWAIGDTWHSPQPIPIRI